MTQPVRGTAWGGAMRLLVEGEQHLAAGLRNGLEAEGFAVEAGRRSSCTPPRGARGTKVEGLDNGADDHLTKPFSSAVVARLRALPRRGVPERPAVLEAGALPRDRSARRAAQWEVDRPFDRDTIQTIRGAGYRLAVHGG
jgi:DNA-binding response OmpR family regulator